MKTNEDCKIKILFMVIGVNLTREAEINRLDLDNCKSEPIKP
jgi:hypothetical protein